MSDLGGRPPSGRGRTPTNVGRPPGTGSRGRGIAPASCVVPDQQWEEYLRPGTRGGMEQGGALNAQIKVADRPMTRQGLSGMKTGVKGLGPQRQVLDKSYYMGQLRAKISELSTEIAKMQKEVDQFSQENSAYVTYEKRAENLAAEIKDLQGQLADYNTLVDKLNTDTEMDDIIEDYNALKTQNEREQKNIDEIFTQKREKEQQIRQLEVELDQERRMAESLVEDMPAEQRAKYAKLKTMNNTLQSDLEQKQQELDALTTRIRNLEDEVSSSPVKQEAVSLYEKINELESKKQSLLDEMEKENKGSPAEERERLLKQVKENNQEIASMERRITELKEKIESINSDIQNLDMDLEEHQGERNQKYRELKKREETMQEFLDTFEETKEQELERKKQLEGGVVAMLEHMSRGMTRTKHMPTPGELKQMQDDLNFKETEMQKSQSTAVSLASEHTRLQMDLEKVEQLEGKITSELDSLKEKIDLMTKELEIYNDLDGLKDKAEEKKRRLQGEKKALSLRREAFKKHVQRLSSSYDATKGKLVENETYSQLGNLERKWQHHEQNNFVMKEFIASKSMESDYRPIKQDVSAQLDELNKILIQNLGK